MGNSFVNTDSNRNPFSQEMGVVVDTDENTGSKTYQYNKVMRSISLVNEGIDELVLKVNGLEIKIKGEEGFSDAFEPFKSFEIDTTNTYRMVVRR